MTRFLRVMGLGGEGFCCWLLLVLYSGLGGRLLLPMDGFVERSRFKPPVRPECGSRGVGAASTLAALDAERLGGRAAVRSSSSTGVRLRFLSVDLRSAPSSS